MTTETSSALREIGVDLNDLTWQDLSICDGMETNLFFDSYESDQQVANMMDQVCLSCPVRRQCLETGVDESRWGLWGGVFLVSGKADARKNSHKTAEIWQEIRSGLDG